MNETHSLEESAIHLFFANYLQRKIEDGHFPNGCLLPLNDFMMVFKMKFADILKAVIELEKRELIQIVEKSQAKVVKGKETGQLRDIDVRDDIKRVSRDLGSLEIKALDNAWPRIDRMVVRELFLQDRVASPSQRIWRMIDAMHSQIVGNCDNAELFIRINALQKELDFFRCLYLEAIPADEILSHALSLEAIGHAILACDQEGARFHLLAHLGQFEEKLQNIFKSKYMLSCNKGKKRG